MTIVHGAGSTWGFEMMVVGVAESNIFEITLLFTCPLLNPFLLTENIISVIVARNMAARAA